MKPIPSKSGPESNKTPSMIAARPATVPQKLTEMRKDFSAIISYQWRSTRFFTMVKCNVLAGGRNGNIHLLKRRHTVFTTGLAYIMFYV